MPRYRPPVTVADDELLEEVIEASARAAARADRPRQGGRMTGVSMTHVFFSRDHVLVTGYSDGAVGELAMIDGKLRMATVKLRP